MAIKGFRKNDKKRLAEIVSLVFSVMKNIGNEDGFTIGKIVDYITDVGRQIAPKREVAAILKRCVEFGIVKKRGGRYFVKYKTEKIAKKSKVLKKPAINGRTKGKSSSTRPIRRKQKKRKGRSNKIKTKYDRAKSLRKSAIQRLAKSRGGRSPNAHKFFELYVNPCCRVSAKSSVASTQMFEQEETENCAC